MYVYNFTNTVPHIDTSSLSLYTLCILPLASCLSDPSCDSDWSIYLSKLHLCGSTLPPHSPSIPSAYYL